MGAVSTTGHGESISKVCLAHRVVQAMQDNPANKVFLKFRAFVLYLAPMTEVISVPRQVARVWRICRTG